MKIQTYFCFFILITSGFYSAVAQETNDGETVKIDSLKILFNNYHKEDTYKVMLMNEYAKSCVRHSDFTRGLILTKEARNLSRKIDYANGEILYFRTMADFCTGNLSFYYQKQADWFQTDRNQDRNELEPPFKIEPRPDNLNFKLVYDSLNSARQYFIKLMTRKLKLMFFVRCFSSSMSYKVFRNQILFKRRR